MRLDTPLTTLLAGAVALASVSQEAAAATLVPTRAESNDLHARQASSSSALPSPTGYAPIVGACPPTPSGQSSLVRDSSGNKLSSSESSYLGQHKSATQQAWKDWLKRPVPGAALDSVISGGVDSYLNNLDNVPRVGLALSGGSVRATLWGTGFLQGIDARNTSSQSQGVSGLLQLASHVAGLSGGSWAVGSLALNDWPTVPELHDSIWQFDAGLLNPPQGVSTDTYRQGILSDMRSKLQAGAAVSLIDLWGRSLGAHLLNTQQTNYGANSLWTDIRSTGSFANASYPFPLITTTQYVDGTAGGGGNGSILEINPFETGSYDNNVNAFIPTEIFGTPLDNGAPTSTTGNQCVYGIQNSGYMMALSSAIFNQAQDITSILLNGIISAFTQVAGNLAGVVSNPIVQIFNPFQGYGKTPYTNLNNVSFVDGGEDGQTVPLAPLVAQARELDMIIALDSNPDTQNGWPAGYSLYATYQRFTQFSDTYGKVPYPKIPDSATMVNLGLNTRPTFFGCHSSRDVVNGDNGPAPIIVLFANYPWTTLSNYSTTQVQFSQALSQAGLDNGAAAATLGGQQDWATCLACAAIQRGLERSKTQQPGVCQSCFDLYCWNGTTSESQSANAVYSPTVGTPTWVTQNAGTINRNAVPTNAAGLAQSGGVPAPVLLVAISLASLAVSQLL